MGKCFPLRILDTKYLSSFFNQQLHYYHTIPRSLNSIKLNISQWLHHNLYEASTSKAIKV